MADHGAFRGEPIPCGSFSQLLFADDDDVVGLDTDGGCYNHVSSHQNPPKMLCFGDSRKESDFGFSETTKNAPESAVTSNSSSSVSSTNNSLSRANKKRYLTTVNEFVQSLGAGARVPAGSQRNCKKMRIEDSTLTGHAKVKKEKLGGRIAALQQLVSPYGKTDTASVLHEAMGYIRFLHEQVQVLCSPYLKRLLPSSSVHLQEEEGVENGEEEPRNDLRSRGLRLVPVESTSAMVNNNGADLWSPATRNQFLPSQ